MPSRRNPATSQVACSNRPQGRFPMPYSKPPLNSSASTRSHGTPSSIALANAGAFCVSALLSLTLLACEPAIPTPAPPPTQRLTAEQRAGLQVQAIYWRIDGLAVEHPGVQYQAPTSTEIWKGCLSLLLEAKGLPPDDWGLTVRDSFYGSIIGQAAKSDWPDFCRVRNGAGGD